MKKNHPKYLRLTGAVIFSLCALLLSNCTNNLDSMMTEYNKNFAVSPDSLLPGDSGYDESKMLLDKYTLSLDSSFTVVAPKGDSYRWSIYKVDITETSVADGYIAKETEKTFVNLGGAGVNSQSLAFYVPDISEIIEGTYELRLRVVARGREYKDAATLVVYKPFYGYY